MTDERATTADEHVSPQSWRAHAHRIAPLFLLIAAVATLISSIAIGFGSLTSPKAGFWPAVVSVAMIALAAVVLFLPNPAAEQITRNGLLRVLCVVAGMFLAVALQPHIGFFLPFFVLVSAFLVFIARRRIWVSLTVSAVTVAAAYLIFVVLLRVNLSLF